MKIAVPVFVPRWNYYRCPSCHGFFVTVQIIEGHTPNDLSCKATKDCKGKMVSGGHPAIADWPITAPKAADAEWYRPKLAVQDMLRQRHTELESYINKGGLVLRRPDEKTPTFPEAAQ